jgi:nucleoside diphosphate kinase
LASRAASTFTSASGRQSRLGQAATCVAGAAGLTLGLWKVGGSVAAEPHSEADVEARVAELERRVREKDIEAAEGKHAAFVFIKPHAVTDAVKALVKKQFGGAGISVVSEGEIKAEVIDEKQLIDTHYGAIAAKAVKLTPDQLNVQPKAQDTFEKTFGLKWEDAVKSGKVFNATDATKTLGITSAELEGKWRTLKAGTNLLKFGGGFYCGQVDDIFVINAFYMAMRGAFTKPGTSIYYYVVEWDPKELSWGDFRAKTLGATDPAKADKSSVRHQIYANWQSLGLKSVPNTGDNGVHASASPFEALSEKNNWLGVPLTKDFFGRGMLASGVPLPMLQSWCSDPQVSFDGKMQSLFDLLEDLNAPACLDKSAKIAAKN